MGRPHRVWVSTGVAMGVLLGLELLLVTAARDRAHQVLLPGPASMDEVVGALAAALAVALGGWLLVSSVAAVLAHAPGRLGRGADRVAARWAPLLTRRVAAVLVGAVAGGALGPATALAQETTPFPGFSAAAPVAAGAPTVGAGAVGTGTAGHPAPVVPPAGWVPSRPVQRPVVAPDLVTSGRTGAERPEVVVHRGDTLWSLAAAHLGPDATDAEVAEAWPRWHRVNREVIGDDPDRLLPGQVLSIPTTATDTTATVAR